MQSQNVALERDVVSWQDSSLKKMGGAEIGYIVKRDLLLKDGVLVKQDMTK